MICDNYIRKAKVVRVIDGDTVVLDIDLGFYVVSRHKIRLLRINCPEKYGETKPEGLKAKEFTENELLNKEVYLYTIKTDSFGRFLGEIYYEVDGVVKNISDELLASGNAVEYKVRR